LQKEITVFKSHLIAECRYLDNRSEHPKYFSVEDLPMVLVFNICSLYSVDSLQLFINLYCQWSPLLCKRIRQYLFFYDIKVPTYHSDWTEDFDKQIIAQQLADYNEAFAAAISPKKNY
jgi:hypothetical protein